MTLHNPFYRYYIQHLHHPQTGVVEGENPRQPRIHWKYQSPVLSLPQEVALTRTENVTQFLTSFL